MSHKIPSPDSFPAQWHSWTATIGFYLKPHDERSPMDLPSYEELHQRLLAECREMKADGDAIEIETARQLEELIGPWVSLEALAQADEVILRDLHRRAEMIDDQLNATRGSLLLRKIHNFGYRRLTAIFAAAIGLLVAIVLIATETITRAKLVSHLDSAQNAIGRASQMQLLIGMGCIVGVLTLGWTWWSYQRD